MTTPRCCLDAYRAAGYQTTGEDCPIHGGPDRATPTAELPPVEGRSCAGAPGCLSPATEVLTSFYCPEHLPLGFRAPRATPTGEAEGLVECETWMLLNEGASRDAERQKAALSAARAALLSHIARTEGERDAALARAEALENALRGAADGLLRAHRMLSAICETDSTVDRRKARDAANEAHLDARAALASPAPATTTNHKEE